MLTARRILVYYDGCLAKAVMNVYPEYKWQPWRFVKAPKGYWQSTQNLRDYIEWLGKQLGITQLDDWYKYVSMNFPI